jgi:uncharacterized membrane protein
MQRSHRMRLHVQKRFGKRNMTSAHVYALAFGIGVIAGLRTFTAPATISWAAHLRWINLQNSALSFMSSLITLIIASILCIGELIMDKLPMTPSRKQSGPFAARVVIGALSGLALAIAGTRSIPLGAIAGALGAVAGTMLGYEFRTRLVKLLNIPDFIVAMIEDAIAIAGGFFIVSRF